MATSNDLSAPSAQPVLAIAIEDSVQVWYQSNDEQIRLPAREIPEGGNYIGGVRKLLFELLQELHTHHRRSKGRNVFNSIHATIVSVPGVVHENKVLRQIPLWHSKQDAAVTWMLERTVNGTASREEVTHFDFSEQIAELAQEISESDKQFPWQRPPGDNPLEVYVVNDATACAAHEYERQYGSGAGVEKNAGIFAYVKIYNGINVGVVRRSPSGKLIVAANHPESGHGYPLPHERDARSSFSGVCHYHRTCFEGLVAVHSLYERARRGYQDFSSWTEELKALERKHLRGQKLDNALLRYILAEEPVTAYGTNIGVDLIAHYVAQLVHQIALSALAPRRIIIGGQMATDDILSAIRTKMRLWIGGYPDRPEFSEKIHDFIVRSNIDLDEKDTIEVRGAMAIGLGRVRREEGVVLLFKGDRRRNSQIF